MIWLALVMIRRREEVGSELRRVREAADGLDGVIFTGALPHTQLPACLSACDIGVAPFDPDTHPSLSLGFYWSPLKIFEYMAAGLPVVAPAIDRIPNLVGHNSEGLLYDSAIPTGLPHASAAARTVAMRRPCSSWVPCEKLSLATSMPARIRCSRAG